MIFTWSGPAGSPARHPPRGRGPDGSIPGPAPAGRGARRTLAAFKPVIYVENDRVENSPELISLLGELGYDIHWYLSFYITADNHFGTTERLFPIAFVDRGGAYLSGIGFAVNLLCIHESTNTLIEGLRRVTNPLEHPYRRDCMHLFAGKDSADVPVLHEGASQ